MFSFNNLIYNYYKNLCKSSSLFFDNISNYLEKNSQLGLVEWLLSLPLKIKILFTFLWLLLFYMLLIIILYFENNEPLLGYSLTSLIFSPFLDSNTIYPSITGAIYQYFLFGTAPTFIWLFLAYGVICFIIVILSFVNILLFNSLIVFLVTNYSDRFFDFFLLPLKYNLVSGLSLMIRPLLSSEYKLEVIDNSIKSILPELFLFLVSIIIFILLLYYSILKKNNIFFISSLSASFRYFYLFIFISFLIYNSYELYYFEIFHGSLISYWYICVFKEFCLILMFFFFFALKDYLKFSKFFTFEILILFTFVFISFLFLLSSNNFLIMYLLLEVYNLSIYAIIALRRNSNSSVESAIKYFIFGSFSSVLFLYSSSLIYGSSSFISFSDLNLFFWLDNSNLPIIAVFGSVLFLLSFLFKMGIAPFHSWAVEVYSGAPLIVTFFLTLVPKLVLVITLLRVYLDVFFEFYQLWSPVIYIFIFSTSVAGVFGALYQIKLKRIFIYSSIFNSSFFLIPFVALTEEVLASWFFFLFVYSFNVVNLFFLLLSLKNLGSKQYFNNLSSLVNLFKHNKLLGLYFTSVIASLAGLPPFSGFFGKFFLFFSLMNSNYFFLFFFLNIMNLIGLYYYLRIIKLIFINNKRTPPLFLKIPSKSLSVILSFFFLVNCLFFFFSEIVLVFCHNLAFDFLGSFSC